MVFYDDTILAVITCGNKYCTFSLPPLAETCKFCDMPVVNNSFCQSVLASLDWQFCPPHKDW